MVAIPGPAPYRWFQVPPSRCSFIHTPTDSSRLDQSLAAAASSHVRVSTQPPSPTWPLHAAAGRPRLARHTAARLLETLCRAALGDNTPKTASRDTEGRARSIPARVQNPRGAPQPAQSPHARDVIPPQSAPCSARPPIRHGRLARGTCARDRARVRPSAIRAVVALPPRRAPT